MTDRIDVEACVMRLLSRRDHSTGELRTKLRKREFDHDVIEEVLTIFAETGWLDDEAFARHQAEILVDQGWGPIQIREKLMRHGVDAGLASSTIESLDVDWVDRARARVAHRYDDLQHEDQPRAYRHLTYRGFPGSIARRALFD